MPLSSQRVVALLALHEQPVTRAYLAACLWPDVGEPRARGNLRSAIWRLSEPRRAFLEANGIYVRLHPDVEVDARELETTCRRVLRDPLHCTTGDMGFLIAPADLLQGWYEDWLVVEREHLRQLRLYALEAVCDACMQIGQIGFAVEAGLAAVAEEPLRESAHRLLILAHASRGNIGEAYLQYRSFHRLLRDELGLEPSVQMQDLIRRLCT